MKFVVGCKKFFGLKPGQTLKSFLDETKKLDSKDRKEIAPLLSKELGDEVEGF